MNRGTIIRKRYRIEELLGQGSMGSTYKAFDLKTLEPVALKILHFSRLQEWKALELFEREAQILQRLDHPRIPAYREYFSVKTSQDLRFILVQAYIEGKSLQQRVDEGWRATETEILDIFLQLVEILDDLHGLNPPVLHRDIHPKNIILASDNKVYLVDFGAVRERLRTSFLSASTLAGTYGYMPFEQYSGQVGPASDYYALGATLLYLLTHRHPSEFPTEGLRLQFHPYLQATPATMRLLNGLLEPAAEKRLASPEQIKHILQSGAEELQFQPDAGEKPYGSNIQKTFEEENQLRFLLPGKAKDSRLGFASFWLLFVAVLTGAAFSTDEIFPLLWSIPFWVAGFAMFGAALYKTFGKTTLLLAPQWGQLLYALFGFRYSQRFPTALLKQTSVFNEHSAHIEFRFGAKTLKFGSHLSLAEKEWLIQEMQRYASLYAMPESESSAIPHGSKIRRDMIGTNSLRFSIPGKFKWEVLGRLGFIGIWLGGVYWFTVEGGFSWFMIPFWFFGVLGLLDALLGVVKMLSRTTLALSPGKIALRKSFLGIGFSRQVEASTVKKVNVARYMRRNREQEPCVTIHAEAKALRFGSALSPLEREWLVREIKDYLEK